MRFVAGELYHIYNRGNNRQKIFFGRDNYLFFLKKMKKELIEFADILAYCLMPNHYHLLIHVKDETTAVNNDQISGKLSRKLGTLQSSYTQAINKRLNRTGSLFQQKAKSKHLEEYALVCFHYIHQNPVAAGLCNTLESWEFSSFRDYSGLRDRGLVNKNLGYRLIGIPENMDQFYKESLGVINSGKFDWIK